MIIGYTANCRITNQCNWMVHWYASFTRLVDTVSRQHDLGSAIRQAKRTNHDLLSVCWYTCNEWQFINHFERWQRFMYQLIESTNDLCGGIFLVTSAWMDAAIGRISRRSWWVRDPHTSHNFHFRCLRVNEGRIWRRYETNNNDNPQLWQNEHADSAHKLRSFLRNLSYLNVEVLITMAAMDSCADSNMMTMRTHLHVSNI